MALRSKKFTKVLWTVLLVFITGLSFLYFYVNKEHRNPQNEEALKVSPSELYNSLYRQKSTRYIDKTIELKGIPIIAENKNILIFKIPEDPDASVRVSLAEQEAVNQPAIKGDNEIKLIGICTGIKVDTLMEDLINVDILIRDGQILK